MRWVRDHARLHCPKPEPAARGRGRARRGLALRPKKAASSGSGRPRARTGRLIDWECGDRDRATLDRLLARLERWGVRLFCTDDWAPTAALPVGRHYIGKDQTQRSESNNARQRHWSARFRRRTCVVSRSVAMVEATMGAVRLLSLQWRQSHVSVSRVKPPCRRRPLTRIIQCAQMARVTSGGRFHPDSCRFDLVADERSVRATGQAEAS